MQEDEFQRISGLADHFAKRKERAATRLAGITGRHLYFAILGLRTSVETFEILPNGVRLQRVVEPPGEVELASALKQQHLFSALGRYTHSIEYELAVDLKDRDENAAANLAWWCISALRVRCLPDLLVPAVADHSWSTISAVPERTCDARLLEDAPRAHKLEEAKDVDLEDMKWVSRNLLAFITLLDTTSFRIAVDALCTHHHHENVRVMVAMLWAGIEALFGINAELTFRLAIYIAAALEPRGKSRHEIFREAKRLYAVRSKVVHGVALGEAELKEHVIAARALLSRLLRAFTEQRKIPEAADLEETLLVGE